MSKKSKRTARSKRRTVVTNTQAADALRTRIGQVRLRGL